jgi:hypothetical protein
MSPRPPAKIEQWQVYYIRNAPYANKDKFVVLVCYLNGEWHGFFINSIRNPFYDRSPEMRVCAVEIYSNEHHFLRHDSWVMCDKTKPFSIELLTDYQGKLSGTAINDMVYNLERNEVLKRFYKELILGRR